MNGNLLKLKIIDAGFELVEVARLLSISPQNLQNKLNTQDVKVGFLRDVARCINRSVYYLLDIEDYELQSTNSSQLKNQTGSFSDRETIRYLENIIEIQKSDLESKRIAINALQEALDQAKARIEEHGLTSRKIKN